MIQRLLNVIMVRLAKRQFKKFGTGTKLSLVSSQIVNKGIVGLGNHVFIGPRAYISAHLEVSDYVMVGPGLMVIGGNHAFGVIGKRNRFLKPGFEDTGRVVIGEDAWIGANVTLLPNVVIGMGAVIGAGSLVNKSIPPFCLAAGNPAKVKKVIFSNKELKTHLEQLSYPSDLIENIVQERREYCDKNNIPCQL